jgi:hypothetical protein
VDVLEAKGVLRKCEYAVKQQAGGIRTMVIVVMTTQDGFERQIPIDLSCLV